MMVSDPFVSASEKNACTGVLALNGGILQLERRGEHASLELVTTPLLEPPGSAAGQPIMSDQSWPWGEDGCGLSFSKSRISWDNFSSPPSDLCRSPDSTLSELHEKCSETQEQKKLQLKTKARGGSAHSCIMESASVIAALFEKDGRENLHDIDVQGRNAALTFAFPSEAGGVARHADEDKDESIASEVDWGFAEEDIDDLEAVLGFRDDEEEDLEAEDKNSASVPSESISHFGPPPPSVVVTKETFSGNLPSTRKRPYACDREKWHDEYEVESKRRRASEREPLDIFTGRCNSSPDVSIVGTSSAESSRGRPLSHEQKSEEVENEDDCDFDESTDELQMLCDDFGYDITPEQQCSSCSREGGGHSVVSGSARQSRKQKIQETVKLLREAIPGGSCMDTSIVLDEAIHYVKRLQLQVQTLGAKRFEVAQRTTT